MSILKIFVTQQLSSVKTQTQERKEISTPLRAAILIVQRSFIQYQHRIVYSSKTTLPSVLTCMLANPKGHLRWLREQEAAIIKHELAQPGLARNACANQHKIKWKWAQVIHNKVEIMTGTKRNLKKLYITCTSRNYGNLPQMFLCTTVDVVSVLSNHFH